MTITETHESEREDECGYAAMDNGVIYEMPQQEHGAASGHTWSQTSEAVDKDESWLSVMRDEEGGGVEV